MTTTLATAVVPTDDQLAPDDDPRLRIPPSRRSREGRELWDGTAPSLASAVKRLAAPEISPDRRPSVAPAGASSTADCATTDSGAGTDAEELDWITSHS